MAMLLANRPPDFAKTLASIADQLRSAGLQDAAQLCYLLVDCPIQSVSLPDARLVLLGGDTSKCAAAASATSSVLVSDVSIQMTEFLEFAKLSGNPQVSPL